MPDDDTVQDSPTRRFGGMLRLVLLYLVVVAGVLGVYFAFYVDTRIEQTAVRNFQALDAAAQRLEEIIANLHQIAGNVPVGIDPRDLDDILRNVGKAPEPERAAIERQWQRIDSEVKGLRSQLVDIERRGALPDAGEQQRRSYVNSLQAKQIDLDRLRNQLLDETCERRDTHAALAAISAIANRYLRDFRAIPSATEVTVRPLALAIKPADEALAGADTATADTSGSGATSATGAPEPSELAPCETNILSSLDNLLATRSELCRVDAASMVGTKPSVRRRLLSSPEGIVVEAQDCRTFSRRSPDLTKALPPSRHHPIVAVLDHYGVSVRANLASLVNSVAVNVAPLFDQYLIADSAGRVLYSANGGGFRYPGVVGAPTARKSRLDFVSHVNIKELVTQSAQRTRSELEQGLSRLGIGDDSKKDGGDFAHYGVHSRVETFRVADIQFQAFVHPFQVPGLDMPADAPDGSAVLYMVGIVDSNALSNESIRLRLAFVANALLPLGVLFSLMALLWLWTGGDRLMLSMRHLTLFAVTGLTATILYTLFCLHLLSGIADNVAFDRALQRLNQAIHDDFDRELEVRLDSLAQSTAAMLAAGEAPARNATPLAWNDVLAAGADGAGANVAPGDIDPERARLIRRQIERSYYCRPDPADPGSAATDNLLSRYPAFDLAFLLDARGTEWQCMSYRTFDTRPLNLSFRDYFKRPAEGRLWHSDSIDGPPFFMDRITSILDGTTETVVAARPHAVCSLADPGCVAAPALARVASATIVGRLHALEDTILPPHMRFAVVDNASGRTLFHSVGSRSLATNFIRETEADQSLLALIDSHQGDFVDLTYYGESVRAYVQPLADGVPWTLITYSGHELADTLNIIAVSATAASMMGTLGLLVLVALAAALADRLALWLAPLWHEVRQSVFTLDVVRPLLPAMLAIGAAGTALLAFSAWLAPRFGATLALLVMASATIALFAALAWRIPEARAGTAGAAARPAPARPTVIAILVTSLLTLGVLPTFGWYHTYRAQLSAGLGVYLREATRDAITGKCERQTSIARRYQYPDAIPEPQEVFRFGWTLLPAAAEDARPEPQPGEPPECLGYRDAAMRLASLDRALPAGGNRTPDRSDVLLAVSGFSALGSDLTTRSAFTRSRHGTDSPAQVLGALLGGLGLPSDVPSRAGAEVSDVSIVLVAVLVGALLIWLVTVSLSDRVLGMRLSLGYLLPAVPDAPPRSWWNFAGRPLRACVVHRSEVLWERLLHKLIELRTRGGARPVVMRAHWNGSAVEWEPYAAPPAPATADGPGNATAAVPEPAASEQPAISGRLYVVAGLDRFIVDDKARERLLEALEDLAATAAPIVIWSRILPGTWLAALTERVSGDLARVTGHLAFATRWGRVLGPFDVRRLEDGADSVDGPFAQALARGDPPTIPPPIFRQLYRAMLREARANPELLELAASIARRTSTDTAADNPVRLALQRFRAAAASHFHTVWAASSRDERLQLLALASGGFANPTQTVTLSSLANRGLIETRGVIRLRSEAFRRFILKDLDHDSLLRWRDQGHGNVWRSIWPPIVLVVVMAAAFFVSSSPEALAPLVAILAAGIGAVPVIGSLIRGVKDLQGGQGSG